MNFDCRDPTITDEYFVTALQIFDCCGVESSGYLCMDALMDKFSHFVKPNKAETSYLKTLLDPEQKNPVINVTKLAKALHKYSESQKTKVDLDESFNLKTGQTPQDSDSGISTDGLQLVEDLQCELREKEHLIHQLRSQLDFTDRQHEEVLASVSAERDTLLRHLNMVREENATLSHVRSDNDEACERLCASETALADAKRELDSLRKRAKVYQEQVATLEIDKLTLQELLSKSKDECHRINEMYAARQSALLEANETFKTENADLTSRLHDQDDFMQQILKEKVLLEMELKDLLNKSNQTHLRLDRSIDVSYTEDQMLTALDSLNADSRFAPENRLLDEESFLSALKEDQGRATNLSLFDEIRLSICSTSRHNLSEFNYDRHMDRSLFNCSLVTFGTQTDYIELPDNLVSTQSGEVGVYDETDSSQSDGSEVHEDELASARSDVIEVRDDKVATGYIADTELHNNKAVSIQTNVTKVHDMEVSTQTNVTKVHDKEVSTQTGGIVLHGDNLANFSNDNFVKNKSENVFPFDKTPKGLVAVETQTDNKTRNTNDGYETEKQNADINVRYTCEETAKTVETQTDTGENRLSLDRVKEENKFNLVDFGTQTIGMPLMKRPFVINHKIPRLRKFVKQSVETQTDTEVLNVNNNTSSKCLECDTVNKYTAKLERDVKYSNIVVSEVQNEITKYEENLVLLQHLIDEGNDKNRVLQSVVKDLNTKIEILEAASEVQGQVIKNILETEVCCVACQTDCDQSSVSTQVEVPCAECEKRSAVLPHRSLKRFFWDPVKCLFQVFAVVCFLAAVCVLCGVVRAGAGGGGCRVAPWRWLHAQDIMDLLLRIEYTAEVPM